MKKNLLIITAFILSRSILAQEFPNPFLDDKNTFNHEDIIILWNEPNTDNITQEVFGYDWFSHYAQESDNLVLSITPATVLDNTTLGSGHYLSATSGRFNKDSRDDIVYIMESSTGIQCALNELESEFHDSDSSYTYQLAIPQNYVDIPTAQFSGAPRSAIGDFDNDGTDEVAIAWREPDGNLVHIQILDSDNSQILVARASISDQSSIRVNNAYNAYDLASGDLNGDGADEIILMGVEESGSGNSAYQAFVKVYEVNNSGSNTITPKAYFVVDDANIINDPDDNNFTIAYAQTAVTSFRTHADTLNDKSEDVFAAFAFVYGGDPQFNYDNYFQYLIRSNSDLSALSIIDTTYSFASSGAFQTEYPLEANTGDLNGDRIEDVVLLTNGGKIFTVINDSLMHKGNSGGVVLEEGGFSGTNETIDRLEIGDVDHDGRDEIITFSKGAGGTQDHTFFINVSGVDTDFSTDTLSGGGYSFTDNSNSNLRSYAIAVGNLDGNDLSFAEPTILSCEYLQPVFVIGAIPSHFDIIDGVEYDVNNCYPVQDCELSVQIKTSQTTSTTSQVEITSDWAVSSSTSVGAQASGISMGTTIEAKYGVKFNEVSTETNSQTVSVAITATADDMVQYLQIPITVYQYPVLNAARDTLCHVIAAFPDNDLSPQTIVANGNSLFNYSPNYEVGNILSYPEISSNYDDQNDLPRTAGSWIILDEGSVPNYTMSPSGGIIYSLTATSGLDFSSSSEAYAAINTGISPLGFGIGLPENEDGTDYLEAEGLPSDYPPNAIEINQLNLYSNSIDTETEFTISSTNIIGSPNEFNYVISPKIYWNTDGTGKVSFDLDIDSEVGSGSFWSLAYTAEADPALNMPYRYDLIHNPNLTNLENLDRTKSIRFSSYLPQEGDTVSLFLKVFNYSFLPTDGPIEFTLYHEDPDEGGTPIADLDGNTLFQTTGSLGPRGRVETEVKFIAFANLIIDDFAKIYVVLDPDDLIPEIHEENNKGWTQYGYSCNQPNVVTGIDELEAESESSSFLNIYPIPANEQMIIEHDMTSVNTSQAFVSIYNMMGKQIAQFDVSVNYEGRIYWNTRSVSPGFYIVNVHTESGILESRKVIVSR